MSLERKEKEKLNKELLSSPYSPSSSLSYDSILICEMHLRVDECCTTIVEKLR